MENRQIKTAIMDSLRSIKIIETEPPRCEKTDVIIKVHSVGICESDVVYYTKGKSGVATIEYPHVLGHECAGEIIEVGADVSDFVLGDRVAIEPGLPCFSCSYCNSGNYNLCKSISFMSTPIKRPYSDGALSQYIVRPAKMLFKLPKEISFAEGALLEPLSVALNAVERSSIHYGQSALILGSGPIGMCILMVLKAIGISDIFVVDLMDTRLQTALLNGAKNTFKNLDQDNRDIILNHTNNQGVTAVFDTTCYSPLINDAISLLDKNAVLTMIGVPQEQYMELDIKSIFLKQATLNTSFRYANQYETAINLVKNKQINLASLISHNFPLEETQTALELAAAKKDDVMKIIVNL